MTSLRSGVKLKKMIKCIKHRLINIFSLSEEVGRLDYFITSSVLIFLLILVFKFEGWWTLPALIILLVLGYTNIFRRLNDLWISKWSILLFAIPIVNTLFHLYILFKPGKHSAHYSNKKNEGFLDDFATKKKRDTK